MIVKVKYSKISVNSPLSKGPFLCILGAGIADQGPGPLSRRFLQQQRMNAVVFKTLVHKPIY